MLLYRISNQKYVHDLSGRGAALFGGRWNPRGMPMVYTTGSISLACLEYLVHNFHVLATKSICLTKIRVNPSTLPSSMEQGSLPFDWQEKSYMPQSTQALGEQFLKENASYVLKVPSAIVPSEFNYLLNPSHPDHEMTFIEEYVDSFVIDERLL